MADHRSGRRARLLRGGARSPCIRLSGISRARSSAIRCDASLHGPRTPPSSCSRPLPFEIDMPVKRPHQHEPHPRRFGDHSMATRASAAARCTSSPRRTRPHDPGIERDHRTVSRSPSTPDDPARVCPGWNVVMTQRPRKSASPMRISPIRRQPPGAVAPVSPPPSAGGWCGSSRSTTRAVTTVAFARAGTRSARSIAHDRCAAASGVEAGRAKPPDPTSLPRTRIRIARGSGHVSSVCTHRS
jgi:hypothetical protein